MRRRLNVVVVGLGEIGSRHLQGLSHCQLPLNIWGVDLDPDRLIIAQKRWEENRAGDSAKHKVHLGGWTDLPASLDVAIVATNSATRLSAAQRLSEGRSVSAWLFEKWLSYSRQDLANFERLPQSHESGWVNHPRRSMAWYQDLKLHWGKTGPLRVRVDIRPGGLFTNSIHFVDLVQWWTGEQITNSKWGGVGFRPTTSRRKGYFDSSGVMEATFERGSRLLVVSDPESVIDFPVLRIEWETGSVDIDERSGIARFNDDSQICGKLELQSELSGSLVESIVSTGTCRLTPLLESTKMHHVLLRDIDVWWKEYAPTSKAPFPIT